MSPPLWKPTLLEMRNHFKDLKLDPTDVEAPHSRRVSRSIACPGQPVRLAYRNARTMPVA
jgi:hypothetical protein